jgi:hypothetical protein
MLPPDFVVGFVVFGSSVRVYRLNHEKEVMHADVIGGRASPNNQQLGILSKQVCAGNSNILFLLPVIRLFRPTGAHCFRFGCHECAAFPCGLSQWE